MPFVNQIGVDELSRRYSEGLDLWTGKPLTDDSDDPTETFREEVEDVQRQRADKVDDSQNNPAK